MSYRFRSFVSFLFLVSLLVLVSCQKGVSQPLTPPNTAVSESAVKSGSAELLPLVAGIRERTIASLYLRVLESQHISKPKIDEKFSKETFRLFIKSIDPTKMYFLKSDIDEFKTKYENTICSLAKSQNIAPPFEIYNRYLDRVRERMNDVVKILDNADKLDFTQDEEILRDKGKDFTLDDKIITEKNLKDFAKTPEEAYDRWRKRIKVDLLALKAEEKEKEESRQKAIKDGKEPAKEDNRNPVERLKKRYISVRKRLLLESHIEDGQVLDDIKRAANDEVLEDFLSAVSGVLDPHTNYLSSTALSSFNVQMTKSLEGIGATLSSEDGLTVVKKLTKGGPADKSGQLKENDKITAVGQGKDGKMVDVTDAKLSDVVKLIRGDKGSIVRLDIQPGDGTAAKTIEVVRDKISLEDQAAKSEIFEAGKKPDGKPYRFGYIDLPDFYLDMDALRRGDPNARSTSGDIKKFLTDFINKGVDAVVLDLRLNGGGSLQEAIALSGLFIEKGNTVQTKDGGSQAQQRDDFDPGCQWTGPLVVMQSKFSASASEIFTGAMQDYKRALIIGDSRSHGKGSVQQMRDLSEILFNRSSSDLGAIKVTIQGFYRPSGVSTQRIGVKSDVVLPSFSDIMEGICEEDLDNALTLDPIPKARNFEIKTAYMTPQIADALQKRSSVRIQAQEEFVKEAKRLQTYKEIREKRSTTLNEKKYFEELERLDADKTEKDKFKEIADKEDKIKRDFYVDEVLDVAVDYLQLLDQSGIKFPQERTIQAPKQSWMDSLFGR